VKNYCHILLIYPSITKNPPPALIMSFYNHDGDPETIAVVEGGLLELECESSLSSSLLLHRGGGGRGDGGPMPFTPETVIERNPLPDGSIAIKASTTTPRWNGHRDVKVEHFVVPASNAASVRYYSHTGSPVPIPYYLTRVEYHVVPPDSELEDPPRPSRAYDCDDVDDEDMYSTEYFSQSSFDSADVTSILRGHVHFEDAAFASSYSQKSLLRRRFQILIGMMLIFLVVIFVATFTRSSRSHHNQSSSEDQYQSGVDKISNATLSDASMPASTPNVTENQNVIPLLSMHPKMRPH
jgi:hypothetical protein